MTARGKRTKPTDAHIGQRVRQARLESAMSQTDLGKAMGVTFQQVQKYENGVNRISAGALGLIAERTGKTVHWFYGTASGEDPVPRGQIDVVGKVAATPDGIAMIRAFAGIKSAELRRSIRDLAELVAKH